MTMTTSQLHPRLGLSAEEAARRLAIDGANEIARARPVSRLALFGRQFTSPVIWLLLVASAISLAVGEVLDATVISVIVLLNSMIGFFQEQRAEGAVSALREMTAPRARVVREGRGVMVTAREVVVGDVLVLEAGDIVAADAKLLSAHMLTAMEAALTGESAPVDKSVQPSGPDAPLAERTDCVFMGTAISTGSGISEVTGTGMGTELGRIASLLNSTTETTTPLQRRLAQVSVSLLWVCSALVVLVAVAGILRGWPLLQVFMTAVSLAVAAVPEGLPAVVTIALAVGVQRMATQKVLVRRLPAVETLGCATVICTDKTGTLTTGQMRVRECWGPSFDALFHAAAACNEAELGAGGGYGIGDPTEVAILLAAAERGITREQIEQSSPRVAVHPFDASVKRMSIARADGNLYIKGAIETVLPLCSEGTTGALEATHDMAVRGLRVLVVAQAIGTEPRGATLLGLIGIADPPRTEVVAAVKQARNAGITTVMITGDHPDTARAIASELGILPGSVPAEQLVHARATPEDKIRIVREWKARGAVVAMTGDGVNDAPALQEAHIGIAMGRTGTEVTREAADIVLADDNFASIVAGIAEGRGIFDNIRKTLVFLLSGNVAELLVMLVAALAGWPLPLLPLHLLWINVVTDGLPALALVVDPVSSDVMQRPPRDPREPMLGRTEWRYIVLTGLLQASVALAVFVWALRTRNLVEARNLTFSVLVFGELFRAFAARSTDRLFWEVGAFTNVRLLGVVVVSVLIQLGLHHIPIAQRVFDLGPLSAQDCLLATLVALIPVTVIEMSKLVKRWSYGGAALAQ